MDGWTSCENCWQDIEHGPLCDGCHMKASNEAASHLAAFRKAVRALERLLARLAKGELTDRLGQLDWKPAVKAIDSLHTRRNKPEIRGFGEARDYCDGEISRLRARRSEAEEKGIEAIRAERDKQIAELRKPKPEAEWLR